MGKGGTMCWKVVWRKKHGKNTQYIEII